MSTMTLDLKKIEESIQQLEKTAMIHRGASHFISWLQRNRIKSLSPSARRLTRPSWMQDVEDALARYPELVKTFDTSGNDIEFSSLVNEEMQKLILHANRSAYLPMSPGFPL